MRRLLFFLTLPTIYLLSIFFSKEISLFDNLVNFGTTKALADTTSGSDSTGGGGGGGGGADSVYSGDGGSGCEGAGESGDGAESGCEGN